MSAKNSAGQEPAGTTPRTVDELPLDATQIGVDQEGFVVYFSRIHTSIYVARDDTIVFTRDDIEPGQPLVRFMDHISRTRGWETTNLFGSWPEAFKAQLEADR